MTRPRCLVRSARYVVRMQHRKERKYGGAVRPWAWMEVKPMPVRMVGRKTGSDANETLHEKYISCGSQTLAIPAGHGHHRGPNQRTAVSQFFTSSSAEKR